MTSLQCQVRDALQYINLLFQLLFSFTIHFSKKSKLRELRDQMSKVEVVEKSPQEEDTDKTESFDGESNEEDDTFSSKDVSATKPSQSNRKRTKRK